MQNLANPNVEQSMVNTRDRKTNIISVRERTTVTDIVGFFAFLGLAAAFLV